MGGFFFHGLIYRVIVIAVVITASLLFFSFYYRAYPFVIMLACDQDTANILSSGVPLIRRHSGEIHGSLS
jgi:hypothetical protein